MALGAASAPSTSASVGEKWDETGLQIGWTAYPLDTSGPISTVFSKNTGASVRLALFRFATSDWKT